jgi:hypothetical protein
MHIFGIFLGIFLVGGGGRGRGGRGGKGGWGEEGGAEGDRGWDDLSPFTRFNTCAQRVQKPHNFSLYWGVGHWAGCVYSSKAIALDRDRFWKLLGETEPELVRNLKGLVDFEVRARIRKKRLAEASAAIQASIKRVPPTALYESKKEGKVWKQEQAGKNCPLTNLPT